MTVVSSTYRCDRDGVEVTSDIAGSPEGWGNLTLGGSGVPLVSGDLCPACVVALTEFMQAGGGSFSLRSAALQTPAPIANAEAAELHATVQPSAAQ